MKQPTTRTPGQTALRFGMLGVALVLIVLGVVLDGSPQFALLAIGISMLILAVIMLVNESFLAGRGRGR